MDFPTNRNNSEDSQVVEAREEVETRSEFGARVIIVYGHTWRRKSENSRAACKCNSLTFRRDEGTYSFISFLLAVSRVQSRSDRLLVFLKVPLSTIQCKKYARNC